MAYWYHEHITVDFGQINVRFCGVQTGEVLNSLAAAESAPTHVLRLRRLTVEVRAGTLRGLSWDGVEVLRGLAFLVRDTEWNTETPAVLSNVVEEDEEHFRSVTRCSFSDGGLTLELIIDASDTRVVAQAHLTARERVQVNRAGFVLLHPPREQSLRLVRSDRSECDAAFPSQVSPQQVARNFTGMRFEQDGVAVDIELHGGVYETEDQRNWTDASFKSYTPPLADPAPFTVDPRTPRLAKVIITLTGQAQRRPAKAAASVIGLVPTDELMSQQALAIDASTIPIGREADLLKLLGATSLLVRTTTGEVEEIAHGLVGLARTGSAAVDLEIALETERTISEQLNYCAAALRGAGLNPRRVIALPAAYLKSYQPEGPWPQGPTPADAAAAARQAFPCAAIGGGMLTNFTELNRCRPDFPCDFVTHGTTALVHAADDRSVIETLAGLQAVLASGRMIAGAREYRLGLVSIGMRTNPHGKDVVPNPHGLPLVMARFDPRQRTLFGAAWALGAVGQTCGHQINSMALAMPVGPLGLIHRSDAHPDSSFDDGGGQVYPLFHVVRFVSGLSGRPRCDVVGLPEGCFGVAAEHDGVVSAAIANLRPESAALHFRQRFALRRLDHSSALEASRDPSWLDRPAISDDRVVLDPFEIVFAAGKASAR